MNPIEDRLRAAYSAQAEQLTETRLDELAAARSAATNAIDDLDRGEPTVTLPRIEHTDELAARRRRWAGPGLAAAAVIAVAVGAIALSTARHGSSPVSEGNPSPSISNHPSTTPTAPSSPTTPPSSIDTTPTNTGETGSSYLGAGQTGQRGDVPWSVVGAGWRLVEPQVSGIVYLYDPAGGRYKITDQLSDVSYIVGWSPAGTSAMVQAQDGASLRELDLRSGKLGPVIVTGASFRSYTRPRGLAIVVDKYGAGVPAVQRLGLDGSLQLSYDQNMNGIGSFATTPLYTADGSAFVTTGAGGAVLISNNGDPIRSYSLPVGGQNCTATKLWDDNTLLELCRVGSSGGGSLYLQPLAGGDPQLLIDQNTSPATYAWPLSNGDVLLQGSYGECVSKYRILHPDGTLADLRFPAGVTGEVSVVNMSGDLATFQSQPTCTSSSVALTSYNMVTGTTTKLLDGRATVLSFPST